MIKDLALSFLLFALIIIPMGVMSESMGSISYNISGAVTGGGTNASSPSYMSLSYTLPVGGNTTSSSYQTVVGKFYQSEVEKCNPPASGNWDVDGHEICRDRTITINGTDQYAITIDNGEELELDNVTLSIQGNGTNYERNIFVYAGGNLTIYGNSLVEEVGTNRLYLYTYGFANFTDTVLTASEVYHRIITNGYSHFNNVSSNYVTNLEDPNTYVIANDSYFNGLYIYVENTVNLTLSGFREDVDIDHNISSSTTSLSANLTDTEVNELYLFNNGGTVQMINSTVYYCYHANWNTDNTTVTNSSCAYLLYNNIETGIDTVIFEDFKTPLYSFTKTVLTSGSNKLEFDNSNITLIYFSTYRQTNITNSTLDIYYPYSGSKTNIVNSTITNYALMREGSSTDYKNVDMSNVVSYTMFYQTSEANFTQPADDNAFRLLYTTGAGTRTIRGYVNITTISSWNATHNINRYFPINVTNSDGTPLSDVNISIKNETGSLMTYGTTDSGGMVTLDLTDDDNTTVYEIYLEGDWKKNITMLEPSAPYGVPIVNNLPVVSNVVLSATSGNNLTTDNLAVSFTATDADDDALTNITDWRVGGTSIAVLNMPFDTNEDSTASDAIRDYTIYGNNGTLGDGTAGYAPVWTASGQVGGAYVFDGSDDMITVPDDVRPTSNFTLMIWANISSTQSYDWPGLFGGIGFGAATTKGGIALSYRPGNDFIYCDIYNSTNRYTAAIDAPPLDTWILYTCRYDGTDVKLYYNDTEVKSTSAPGYITLDWTGSSGTVIGREYQPADAPNVINGIIDDVLLFNRTLSAEQIAAIYQTGVDGHQVETLVSSETDEGETWTVAVTPNDATTDGATVVSNSLTIENTPPGQVTLSAPEDGNTTTNRTPQFSWEELTDDDSDSLTYYLNLTCGYTSGGSDCSDDNKEYTVENGNCTGDSFCNFTIPSELKYFGDDNYYYNWTVRAYDDEDYGAWSSVWNITINTDVIITLYNDSVQFLSIGAGQSNDTTDNSPNPFRIRNDGNCFLDINISSTDLLWDTQASPSDYFRYQIDNVTGEVNSLNWSSQNTTASWAPIPIVNGSAMSFLNYSDATDEAEIELEIIVPPGEGAGDKGSTIWFTAGYHSEYE